RQHGSRIRAATESYGHGPRGELRLGEIESDPRIGVESILLHPSDHANHCLPWILRREFDNMNALANRVLTRPKLVGHVFVDDHGSRLGGVVLLIEESSAPQR